MYRDETGTRDTGEDAGRAAGGEGCCLGWQAGRLRKRSELRQRRKQIFTQVRNER